MTFLPCVEVETQSGNSATAAVIWLHGLGASGHDFENIVPELKLPEGMAIRFIFPHAPQIPVTINNGVVMPAWYDILEMNFERKVDGQQLSASASEVHKLIEREKTRGVSADKIIVAGFSQGGAVGYQAALTYPEPLAGLLALSTYFATYETVDIHTKNADIAVMIMHGTRDPVVPEALGKKAVDILSEKGLKPDYRDYPMEHSVCLPQIKDISDWIQARLS